MSASEKSSITWLDKIFHGQRLYIVNLFLLFILLFLVFWISWRNLAIIKEVIRNDFNKQQLVLARQVAYGVNANIKDIQNDLRIESQYKSSFFNNKLQEKLSLIYKRLVPKGISEIAFIQQRGNARVFDASGYSEYNIPNEIRSVYFSQPLIEDFFVLELPKEEDITANPKRLIEIGTPVSISESDKYLLVATVNSTFLIQTIAQKVQSGETGYCWVIDDQGRILYHPKSDYVGENAFEVREKEMPYISFDKINQIQKDKMLTGEEGTGSYIAGWHRGVSGIMDKLIAYSPVKIPGTEWLWSVAVVAPISEVQAAIDKMYTRQIILESLLILGIFITVFVAFVYKRRLSQVLEKKLRRTERSLHQTEEYYHAIFESALDAIFLIDEETRFISMNMFTAKVLCSMLSQKEGQKPCEFINPDQFVGMTLREILMEGDAEFLEKKVKRVYRRKKVESFEHRFWMNDRKIHFNSKYIPIFDEKGNISSVLGISRDITEKKEMSHLIYNTEKLASVGTLAAGVAHEINNPLGVILGFTDLMLDRTEKDTQEYEDLKIIEENCLNCKRIVENLMSFARVTEGLEDVVDVNRCIDTVVQVVKNTLMTNKIVTEMDVEENLPKVPGDARELQQVFFNLINNSAYAMRESGGVLKIRTRIRENNVDIYFIDNGVGIPNHLHNQIFDPFFTTKKVGEGTGLGLSVSYGIVKKYGGTIKFTSKTKVEAKENEKSGTKFVVTLPIHQVQNNHEIVKVETIES